MGEKSFYHLYFCLRSSENQCQKIYKLMIKSPTGDVHNSLILPQSSLKYITHTPRLDYYGLDKRLRQRP